MIGELPRSLSVGGSARPIRSDFRDVLRILTAFGDAELSESEKVYVCLYILYEDFENFPPSDYEAAFSAAIGFIDGGMPGEESGKPSPRLVDWEQDEPLLFPAVNRVAGFEVRAVDYLHWWTFLGYYMEIHDGAYAQILSLRAKKAKHKKLDKWEAEFWSANKGLCEIKEKLTREEAEKRDKLNKMLG